MYKIACDELKRRGRRLQASAELPDVNVRDNWNNDNDSDVGVAEDNRPHRINPINNETSTVAIEPTVLLPSVDHSSHPSNWCPGAHAIEGPRIGQQEIDDDSDNSGEASQVEGVWPSSIPLSRENGTSPHVNRTASQQYDSVDELQVLRQRMLQLVAAGNGNNVSQLAIAAEVVPHADIDEVAALRLRIQQLQEEQREADASVPAAHIVVVEPRKTRNYKRLIAVWVILLVVAAVVAITTALVIPERRSDTMQPSLSPTTRPSLSPTMKPTLSLNIVLENGFDCFGTMFSWNYSPNSTSVSPYKPDDFVPGRCFLRLTSALAGSDCTSAFFPFSFSSVGNPTHSFSVAFEYRIYSDANGPSAGSGDGMTFIIHQDARGTSALGGTGPYGIEGGYLGYLGYDRIQPAFVMELDTYWNDPSYYDPANYDNQGFYDDPKYNYPISLLTTTDGNVTVLGGKATPVYTPNDGSPGRVWIDYGLCADEAADNSLHVFVNTTGILKPNVPDVTVTVDLNTLFSGDTVYMGFTAAAGRVSENHDVLTFFATENC